MPLEIGIGIGICSGGGAPPWTPASLGSALAAWYREDVVLNGSTVSQWTDKSGNGNHVTQGTAAQQPTYVASSSYFGTPALSFDTGDWLINATLNAAIESVTYLAVVRGVTEAATNAIAAITNAGTVNTGTAAIHKTGAWSVRRVATDTSVSPGPAFTDKVIYVATASDTAAAIYTNSKTVGGTGGALAISAFSHLAIGSLSGGGSFRWSGEIAEVGIMNRVATADEINAFMDYASVRYGVTLT